MDPNTRLILANARPPERWEDQERADSDLASLIAEFEKRFGMARHAQDCECEGEGAGGDR